MESLSVPKTSVCELSGVFDSAAITRARVVVDFGRVAVVVVNRSRLGPIDRLQRGSVDTLMC